MRMPRKGILVRLAIYVPLLSYFGWRALAHWQAEQAAQADHASPPAPPADPFEGMPTRTLDVDGKQIKVYEISPEQAEVYLGVPASESAPGSSDPSPPSRGSEPSREKSDG